MNRPLVSRVVAAVLLNFPIAWLLTQSANQRVARQAAALAAGHPGAPTVQGFGYYFLGTLVLGLVYLVLIEALAFFLRGEWWVSGRRAAPETGTASPTG
jgi:hypothetical protein